ncbi:calcium uptake protein 2, mitochondrial [Protopterus annectens]|uniref:calcium uptake protein 2, mitochondrial n=1 Tax=Protopterus annectens TaxID=7888 RepID=UPI001CFAD947|nr:calcium uptake protein 2, mitochondrial [Protopterus annectens]
MATLRSLSLTFRKLVTVGLQTGAAPRRLLGISAFGTVVYFGGLVYYNGTKSKGSGVQPARCITVYAAEEQMLDQSQGMNKGISSDDSVSVRKQRFQEFASLEYEGESFMTPRDFLHSIMLEDTKRDIKKVKTLTKKEVNAILAKSSKVKPGTTLFRNLGDDGLISYTEYLFLLTILIKPLTGFHIAFKMLDVDGNEQVDRKEFLKLKNIIGKKDKLGLLNDEAALVESSDENTESSTTLMMYFFGKGGKEKLQYQEFYKFMVDLQTEVQEVEFLQFSKGMKTMRREDFAEWLLFFSDEENNELYWQNVNKRIPPGEVITLEEFKSFCQFTNNLEDFIISMKMFNEANRPVGLAEFERAVKVATGEQLSMTVLDTVFKIFDLDGDNCLSHQEFLVVLKNRMHRGLRVASQQGMQGYWKCVKKETLKGAQEAWKQAGKSPF